MAAEKLTGAHIWALFFGAAFTVAAMVLYIQVRHQQELADQAKIANALAQSQTTESGNLRTSIENILAVVGHSNQADQVGIPPNPASGTVLWAMNDDIEVYAGDVAEKTYSAAIIKLREELNRTEKMTEHITSEIDSQNQQLLALQSQYNTNLGEFEQKTKTVQSDLRDYQATYQQMVSDKDTEIAQLRSELAEILLNKESIREAYLQQVKVKEDEINRLIFTNIKTTEKIDEIEQITFERPDGIITNVDNATRLVWLNLGTRDNLTKQTTFSVYDKNNQGVGRNVEDIKAQIEVTRVWDNRAEARILQADIRRPISPGDEVYSPLWEQGRSFNFTFVGFIDLDGDGIYDRELLHDIVNSSGAKIDNEVGDDGEWTVNKGLSANTKFIVEGEIPDPSKTEREEEKERFERIVTKRTELINEARLKGIRTVTLDEFLAFIGFKPQRRLFIPGLTERGYTLKAGAASTSVDETVGDRRSTGKVSDIFNERSTGQKTSSGKTSGAFRSGSY